MPFARLGKKVKAYPLTTMAQLPSSLSFQTPETCGSFWLSVASTMAWPTFLTAVSLFYLRVTFIYRYDEGGWLKRTTLLGVVDYQLIAPGHFDEPPQFRRLSGGCISFHQSSVDGSGFSYDEAGLGSLQLFSSGYPILNFCWTKTGRNALNTGVQLARKMIGRPVLEEENISWSNIAISTFGFVFGLVGLFHNPSSLPAGVKSMFIAGVVPDIRVFLLANTITLATSFFSGFIVGLLSRSPSARQASSIVEPMLTLWSLLCFASFGVGCWQINTRRIRKENVWPMFIYWAPATSVLRFNICGIDPLPFLAMAGVLSGIIGENNISCRQGG